MEIVPENNPIKPIQMEEEEKLNDLENDFGQVLYFQVYFKFTLLR